MVCAHDRQSPGLPGNPWHLTPFSDVASRTVSPVRRAGPRVGTILPTTRGRSMLRGIVDKRSQR
jgi:hypothetical protein